MVNANRAMTPATLVSHVVGDEEMAGLSAARVLITAHAPGNAETVARRLHASSARASLPFVAIAAEDLPSEPHLLSDMCTTLLDGAAGGTVFIDNVEAVPRAVQDVMVELLAERESSGASSSAVRVVSGTTVSLLSRVAAGTFSERLFYRLNIIHLIAPPAA